MNFKKKKNDLRAIRKKKKNFRKVESTMVDRNNWTLFVLRSNYLTISGHVIVIVFKSVCDRPETGKSKIKTKIDQNGSKLNSRPSGSGTSKIRILGSLNSTRLSPKDPD